MGVTIIQNCAFSSLNDAIVGTTNNRVVMTGNTSFNTNSSGKSVDLRGTGKMVYVGNYWDVPPTALPPKPVKLRPRSWVKSLSFTSAHRNGSTPQQ
jgi:hypothetical protein